MIIDLTKLNYNQIKELTIEETYSFKEEELKGTDIQELKNVIINGYITKDSSDDYFLSLNIKGKMVLPCSRTLKPVDYDFDINIEENTEMFKKNQKTIDILPIIWENILMEIPIRVISPEAEEIEAKGNGWELITDSED